ncbi:MAG: type II secretion system F family protein [Ardenticatenaceae bacterium]|nr:type II secretion system F family protein [Ardenticatenaceae bacterium]
MSTTLLIVIVAGVILLMIIAAGVALLSGSGGRINVEERLDQFSGDWQPEFLGGEGEEGPQEKATIADSIDQQLSGRGFSFVAPIKRRIGRADLKLRVSEYMAVVLMAITVGGLIGYFLLGGALFAIVGMVLGAQVPRIYANVMATRRRKAFDNQLSDTLNLWVNALRSGFSVLQAMEAIANELPPPISKEFERVLQEVRLGIDMETALDNVLRRVPSEDFDLVVTAVKIQREVGGNLAEILDIISFTIRERVRIKGEIQTLTAQGRISGLIITILPIALGFFLYFINREYIMELFNFGEPFILPGILPCGWLMVGVAVIMIGLGGFAILKIVDIEV